MTTKEGNNRQGRHTRKIWASINFRGFRREVERRTAVVLEEIVADQESETLQQSAVLCPDVLRQQLLQQRGLPLLLLLLLLLYLSSVTCQIRGNGNSPRSYGWLLLKSSSQLADI